MIKPPQIATKYVYENGVHKQVKEYVGQATTAANGVATMYLTDDGTAGGNQLFSRIIHATANSMSNAAAALNVPDAILAEITTGFVSARARTFSGVVVLGITVLGSVNFVGAGTAIYFRVIGE